MKIRTLVLLLAGVGCILLPSASAAFVDPAQIQTEAYVNLVQADQSLDAGRLDEALSLYKTARDYYLQLAKDYPSWEPRIIQYRKTYCDNQITDIERQLNYATAPAPAAYTPSTPPTAPATRAPSPAPGTESVEHHYLQSRIASLEAELAQFDSLQDEADALTQANEQLRRDLEQARGQLAARSSGDQEELKRLQAELTAKDQRIQSLENDLASQEQLRQALNDMEAQVHELRAQQERLNTEINALDAELDAAETRAEVAEKKAADAEKELRTASAQARILEKQLGHAHTDLAKAKKAAAPREKPAASDKPSQPAPKAKAPPPPSTSPAQPTPAAPTLLADKPIQATTPPRAIPPGMSAADYVRELLQQGENEAALATIQEARKVVPNDVNLALIEGIALIRLQHYPQAAGMLIELAKRNPRNAEINATLGAAMMGAGFYEESREALMLAIKLDRNVGGEYYYNLALLNAYTDPINLKAARKYYQQARSMGVSADPKLEETLK